MQRVETFSIEFDDNGDSGVNLKDTVKSFVEKALLDGYVLSSMNTTTFTFDKRDTAYRTKLVGVLVFTLNDEADVHTRLDELLAERDELLTKVEDLEARMDGIEGLKETVVAEREYRLREQQAMMDPDYD